MLCQYIYIYAFGRQTAVATFRRMYFWPQCAMSVCASLCLHMCGLLVNSSFKPQTDTHTYTFAHTWHYTVDMTRRHPFNNHVWKALPSSIKSIPNMLCYMVVFCCLCGLFLYSHRIGQVLHNHTQLQRHIYTL